MAVDLGGGELGGGNFLAVDLAGGGVGLGDLLDVLTIEGELAGVDLCGEDFSGS